MTFKAGELDGGAYIRGGGNSDEKSISQYEIYAMILSTRISSEILTKCDCHAVPMLVTQVACALIVPVRLIPWLESNQVKNIADIFLFRFCSRKEIVKFPE